MIITDESILRTPCSPVKEEDVGELVDRLDVELKRSASLGRPGIGLALPQIGIFQNMAIVRIDETRRINLVNCRIVSGYDKDIFEQEGCLSFPGRFEKTMRFQEIHIENNLVAPYQFICTGLLAVVCQHELDHLVGKLLTDVALPQFKNSKQKTRPNDMCPCGSGRKYKKCCGR